MQLLPALSAPSPGNCFVKRTLPCFPSIAQVLSCGKWLLEISYQVWVLSSRRQKEYTRMCQVSLNTSPWSCPVTLLTPPQSVRTCAQNLTLFIPGEQSSFYPGRQCMWLSQVSAEVGRNSEYSHHHKRWAFCPSLRRLLFNLQEKGTGSFLLPLGEPELLPKLCWGYGYNIKLTGDFVERRL